MLNLHRLVPLSVASCLALGVPMTAIPSASFGQELVVSINVAPPPLPIYAQPPMPDIGYIWAPGYWAWGPGAYYWVPGTWVMPPEVGLLWTPSYWAWTDSGYLWHAGYWGPTVGFYGGINYGFGYTGVGYSGGRWDHGAFFYNRAVNNFGGRQIANVYNEPVHTANATRVSFNGGQGGTAARPVAGEQAAAQERHVATTPIQAQHEQAAAGAHAQLATVNHGQPAVAATSRPANFTGPGVVGARGAPHAVPASAHPAQAPQVVQTPRASAPAAAPTPHADTELRGQPQPAAHPAEEHPAEQRGDQGHDHP